jgi:hypothetical protein
MEWPKHVSWKTNEEEDAPFDDFELDYIPRVIDACPLCGALVSDANMHKNWHERLDA